MHSELHPCLTNTNALSTTLEFKAKVILFYEKNLLVRLLFILHYFCVIMIYTKNLNTKTFKIF